MSRESLERFLQLEVALENTCDALAAKEEAEKKTDLKSVFISSVSHEIRTPINSIMGYTYMLLKTRLNNKQQGYLNKLQKSGQHLLSMINDILDYSKIEAGLLTLQQSEFCIADLMDSIDYLLSDAAAEKGLQLHFNVDNRIPAVLVGDSLRIKQVLINFVSNAIKYTQRGQVSISIRQVKIHEDDLNLKFEVTDTGPGIAETSLEKIFEPFQQLEDAMQSRTEGFGLGLAISKRLANLLGGEVGVQSQLGRGSSFWFTAKVRASFNPRDQARISVEPIETEVLRNLRVLVVEDNEMGREILANLLKDCGCEVELVSNSESAMACIWAKLYDLIILDLHLPTMSGIELSKLIRNERRYSNVPIIAYTASVSQHNRELAAQAGINDYIAKPVDPDQLIRILMNAVNARQSTRPDMVEPLPAGGFLIEKGLVDMRGLSQFLGTMDHAKLYQSLRLFITVSQDGVRGIEEGIRLKNLKMVADFAHRMKLSANVVGAKRMLILCELLEEIEKGGGIPMAQIYCAEIKEILEKVSRGMPSMQPG